MIRIVRVESEEELGRVLKLFTESFYIFGIDLSLQYREGKTLKLLPQYAPPKGRFLLALYRNQAAGCVALREIAEGVCDMRRIYVRPRFRRKGIGRALALSAVEEARQLGYKQIVLDTLPFMREAESLVLSLGFREIEHYYLDPIEGSKMFGLDLVDEGESP